MLPIAINVLLVIHVLTSLLIILLVLMQRPKNEGLGAAFGGGMTENLFGAQTTNVLQTITRWLGGIFFALTLLLSFLYVKRTAWRTTTPVQKVLTAPTKVPAAPAAPLPAATPESATPPVKSPAPSPGEPNREGGAAPGPAPVPATPPLEKAADSPAGAPSAEKPRTSPSDTPAEGKPASPELPTGGQKPTTTPTSVPPGPTVPPAAPSGSSQ